MISTLGSLGRLAYFQLGENQKAIDDLNAVIEKAPQTAVAYQYRAIAHARLGHKDQARADLAQFQKGDSTESSGSTWRSSWQRNWAREPTRRSRSWTPHSRNSPRTLDCTTMQPVPNCSRSSGTLPA